MPGNGGLRAAPGPPYGWERIRSAPLFSIDPTTGRVERIREVRAP